MLEGRVLRVDDREARHDYKIYWHDTSVDLGGLLYLYHDPNTGGRVYWRLRPDTAPKDKEGKGAKYLSPTRGQARRRLYFPPDAKPWLLDAAVPIVFVESEQSALACTAAAWRSDRCILFVGTGGCTGWMGKNDDGESAPLSDFGYFNLIKRETTIWFDGDVRSNPNVRDARRRLAVFLAECKATVKIAEVKRDCKV
jgi:hypothetical protein